MASAIETLLNYTTDNGSDYFKFHENAVPDPVDRSATAEALTGFLRSTMDEVRLRRGNDYADRILKITGPAETHYFRAALLRRELTSDLEYLQHRDHAVHTVNNYLLGWYLFSKSAPIQEALSEQMGRRFSTKMLPASVVMTFGYLWPYASLLHDIGYLLEGALGPLSLETQHEKIRRGASAVNDYFGQRIWYELGINSTADKQIALGLARITVPSIATSSVSSVAASLCELGDLEVLRGQVRVGLRQKKLSVPRIVSQCGGLPSDSFDLWIAHFKAYGQDSMAQRMSLVRDTFYSLQWSGMPKSGIRLLDHAVVSGLILLLQMTFFFRLHSGVRTIGARALWSKGREREILGKLVPASKQAQPEWWWTAMVWATGATAIHNIQQEPPSIPGARAALKPLTLAEDALAYLGILVDVLQEWDRYSVVPQSAVLGQLPIQGQDVQLSLDGPPQRVTIRYGDKDRTKKVQSSLSQALAGWDTVVAVD